MWKKIRFKFENLEKFYKGFPCKKKFPGEFFVKWTQVKIKRISFVKFSAGGPRSIYKEILLYNYNISVGFRIWYNTRFFLFYKRIPFTFDLTPCGTAHISFFVISEFPLLLNWDHFTNKYHRIFVYKEILCKFVPL